VVCAGEGRARHLRLALARSRNSAPCSRRWIPPFCTVERPHSSRSQVCPVPHARAERSCEVLVRVCADPLRGPDRKHGPAPCAEARPPTDVPTLPAAPSAILAVSLPPLPTGGGGGIAPGTGAQGVSRAGGVTSALDCTHMDSAWRLAHARRRGSGRLNIDAFRLGPVGCAWKRSRRPKLRICVATRVGTSTSVRSVSAPSPALTHSFPFPLADIYESDPPQRLVGQDAGAHARPVVRRLLASAP
jgi:hypothetical protein